MSDASRPAAEHPVVFVKGRGAGSNRPSRYASDEPDDPPAHDPSARRTEVAERQAKSILNRNQSPDLDFDFTINPYQGCEHGCVYCFARPTHAYLGLSPGLDFETRLFAKMNAAEVLRKELGRKGFHPGIVALGAATDAYQPIDRQYELARRILEVLAEFDVAVGITTKSALVTRDIDILAPMARKRLVRVHMSIPTLDHELSRRLDPRANSPARRLEAIEALTGAGIPVAVYIAPVIPGLNDHELEAILEACVARGGTPGL
jgi:DNA repair photolyase